MEQFAKLLAENDNGKRKASSQELIVNNIRRLYNRCYGGLPEDISQIEGMVEDVGHTFACIQSLWHTVSGGKKLSHSTMLSYTNSLLIANDLFELDLKQTYADLETQLQVRRADTQRKNPIKNTKISRVDLDDIREDLMTKGPLKNYILFYILTKYPFRLESATLKHIYYPDFQKLQDKGITNYLVVRDNESMMFSFNGYKTSKRYGSREIELDDTLITLFNEYLEDGQNDNQYLFYPEYEGTEEKIQDKMRNNLSVWTKRLLKKYGHNASATDITKLLISEVWDYGTTQDKIKYALWRGHTTDTAAKVYATSL